MTDDLLPPVEVPWKLASSTQLLQSGGPDETTISLFYHEPDDETLAAVDPDQKIVYVKVTASVSPCSLESVDSEFASAFLAGNLPVLHLQADLEVTPASGETGGIRPYFHSAQPLHRRFIETGVVGNTVVEGEADSQFFGKSGSQLSESVESSSRTNTVGGGFSLGIPFTPFSIGGSASTTGTGVSSSRSVTQVVDTTTRAASQERRELISHTTQVENVLTLLSGKYVGTPYLRFSLFPRPLQLLSLDPSDPNLWFSQLLRQRSSGIEGIQEFTAVLVVPRDMDFCVTVRLRRVCLLDDPPGPPNFGERFRLELLQLSRMANYLFELYPIGTPLDELDVDLVSQLTPAKDFRRPALRVWAFRLGAQVVEALVLSPADTAGVVRGASLNYKHMLELWLETLHHEYERELVRSPLERGAVLGENRNLTTCFVRGETSLEVESSTRSVTPLVPIDFRGPIGPEITDVALSSSVRSRAMQTITRWNAIERTVNDQLSNMDGLPESRPLLQHPRVGDVLIARWAKMLPDEERNVDLSQAVAALGLTEAHKTALLEAGVTDLRGLAHVVQASPELALLNEEIDLLEQEVKADPCDDVTARLFAAVLPQRIDFPFGVAEAAELKKCILNGLSGPYPNPEG